MLPRHTQTQNPKASKIEHPGAESGHEQVKQVQAALGKQPSLEHVHIKATDPSAAPRYASGTMPFRYIQVYNKLAATPTTSAALTMAIR